MRSDALIHNSHQSLFPRRSHIFSRGQANDHPPPSVSLRFGIQTVHLRPGNFNAVWTAESSAWVPNPGELAVGARHLQDLLHCFSVALGGNGGDLANLSRAGGSSDSVQIVRHRLREIVHNHMVHVGKVDAPRGHIGADHDILLGRGELVPVGFPLLVGHAPVHISRSVPSFLQKPGDCPGASHRVTKNQGLPACDLLLVQHVT
mmetsp:Transcript_55543/g.121656  ORF Transcript_55543/g.121656 Transcript_55543/m.121656 type:complete len:204 (-) Transcript_55543:100-711(-)